jgi:hypothetical protein
MRTATTVPETAVRTTTAHIATLTSNASAEHPGDDRVGHEA